MVFKRPVIVFGNLQPSARKSNNPKDTPKKDVVIETLKKPFRLIITHFFGTNVVISLIKSGVSAGWSKRAREEKLCSPVVGTTPKVAPSHNM